MAQPPRPPQFHLRQFHLHAIQRVDAHSVRFVGQDMQEVSDFVDFVDFYNADLTP